MSSDESTRGNTGRLYVIGGHETRDGGGIVLKALSNSIGRGKLVVVTLASKEPDEMFAMYDKCFRSHGVRHRHHLRIESREDASSARAMRVLKDATCIFFTGGDQLKITSLLGETAVCDELTRLVAAGTVLAGTSAGASAFSETMMVAGGAEASHRVHADLELAPGLGLTRGMLFDQHFAERGRIGRLLGVVGLNPRMLCVGIDENTAIDMRVGRDFKVIGEGGVTVLDGKHVTLSGVSEEDPGRTMSLFDVKLHLLSQSDRFDLKARLPIAYPSEDVEKAIALGADLRAPRTARARRGARSRGGNSSRRARRASGSK